MTGKGTVIFPGFQGTVGTLLLWNKILHKLMFVNVCYNWNKHHLISSAKVLHKDNKTRSKMKVYYVLIHFK